MCQVKRLDTCFFVGCVIILQHLKKRHRRKAQAQVRRKRKKTKGASVGVPRKLTSKQVLFVKELVHNEGKMTATEAAIKAGYPESSARQKASMLQNPKYYPLVVDYARQLREEIHKKYDVDIHRHFKELQKIREKALEEGSYSAAVQAEVARGKAAGLYIDQKIIKHGKLDQLTESELDEKIGELMREMKIVEGELVDETKKKA